MWHEALRDAIRQNRPCLQRAPYRPAHIHFIVTADGYQPLTTHAFVANSEYIDNDVVFAVKKALIRDYTDVRDPQQAKKYDVASSPFRHVQFDVTLPKELRPGA